MRDVRKALCINSSESEWKNLWQSDILLFPDCELKIFFPAFLILYTVFALFPYQLTLYCKRSCLPRPCSFLYWTKMVLAFNLVLIGLVNLIYIFWLSFPNTLYWIFSSFVLLFILSIYMVVVEFERKRNAKNSGVCFFFTFLVTIIWIFRCWNHIIVRFKLQNESNLLESNKIEKYKVVYKENHTKLLEITDYLQMFIFIMLLIFNSISERKKYSLNKRSILNCCRSNRSTDTNTISEQSEKKQAKSPETNCSFLNRATYAWYTRLIVRGYKKPLEFDDLWELDSHHRSEVLSTEFFKNVDKYIIPQKPTNYYMERRRASFGSTIQCNSNYAQSNTKESRRKSAQSILGVGNPLFTRNRCIYSSGLNTNVNPVNKSSKDIRRASGNYLDSSSSNEEYKNDPNSLRNHTDNLTYPVFHKEPDRTDLKFSSTITKRENLSNFDSKGTQSSARRSVRVRLANKHEFIPGQSESRSDSMIVGLSDDKPFDLSESYEKNLESEEKPINQLQTNLSATTNQSCDTFNCEKLELNSHDDGNNEKNRVKRSCELEFSRSDKLKSKEKINLIKRNQSKLGLLKSLFATFWKPLLYSSVLKLIYDILIFINPWILKLLLAFLQSNLNEPVWHGYFYAFAMFTVAFVQSIILQNYFQIVFGLGMHIKTVITAAVYRKSLILSNVARRDSTSGEIMNLMSSDAQQFVQLMPFINILWSAPFQITIALVFLWKEIGPSTLAGLGVLLLLLPMNAFVARRSKGFQEKKAKVADSRIKLINEIMNGIRVIKLYAWEPSFMKEINRIRTNEIGYLRKYTYLQCTSFLWSCAPFLVAVSSFLVYVLVSEENILDAQKAFVSLSLFNILRFPLFMFPMITSSLIQCSVSMKRLTRFLLQTEIDLDSTSHEDTPGVAAVIERGVFGWDSKDEPILNNISIQFPEGQLTSIMGSVGSGKSSLLHAILGDMECFDGKVNVKGSVAYVPQQPWIFNATLKDNILFNHSYDKDRYEKVLYACNLLPDLNVLPDGDMTEIGDKGINLSGGQKQRVSLARACYADADIYLLDDPLSAVDAHVGLHILNHVFSRSTGLLASKTCILTTHSPKALPYSDRVGLLENGQLIELGNYRQLLHSNKSHLSKFLADFYLIESQSKDFKTDDSTNKMMLCEDNDQSRTDFIAASPSINEENSITNVDIPTIDKFTQSYQQTNSFSSIQRKSSTKSDHLSFTRSSDDESHRHSARDKELIDSKELLPCKDSGTTDSNKIISVQTHRMIQPEQAFVGRVKFKIFLIYLRNIGLIYCGLMLFLYPANQIASLCTNLWLAAWADDAKQQVNLTETIKNQTNFWSNPNKDPMIVEELNQFYARRNYRLGIFTLIGFIQVICALSSIYTLATGHLGCTVRLHAKLLNRILHAPSVFFDIVPQGRIVNRFSQDIATLDNPLWNSLHSTLSTALMCFLTLCISCALNAFMIIPIFSLTAVYLVIQNVYVTVSRQLKRLESISLSPIFSHFSETLSGVTTIRAYKFTEVYKKINSNRQNLNNSAVYASYLSQRWLAILLESVGNLVILAVAIFSVSARSNLSAGFSGLVITYAMGLNQSLNWLVRMCSDLENNIVCIERINEYSNIEQEAPWEMNRDDMPPNWPQGCIEFVNYGNRYRPELELAIRSLHVTVEKGEKLGIVGRTGSGKSSLVLGLFRMLEAAEGQILIDGYDISQLGLHELRKQLTLIPQDPVLFSGTLRFNLDPFEEYSDQSIWNALEMAYLKTFVMEDSNNLGLNMTVAEGGSNLSVGQRQLVCLARALLRRTPILVLDEATAAIDVATDNLIQETIRKEFSHCTVITIAHRLNTILDYDRVLVLEAGQIQEIDSPQKLLQIKTSRFYALAKDAHIVD